MMHRFRPIYTITLLVVLAAFLSSCAQVAPWERGVLAKPQMSLTPNPLQTKIRAHNLNSREAATQLNSTGGGGGCGCH